MTGFEIFMVVMMVVSTAASVIAMTKNTAFDQDDVGVDIPDAGANKSLDFVYGRARVVCNKVFDKVGSANNRNPNIREGDWLSIVATAGQGPCNALKQIYINGSPLLNDTWVNSNKTVDSSHGTIGRDFIEERFKNHVQIQFNMGQSDFFYQMINDLHPHEWDNSCVGKGIASVALRILRDPYKGEIQNSPQIEVELEGRMLRDIRRENDVLAYDTAYGCVGTNPALAILDYVTSPFGMNQEWADVDEYTFAQMANFFDKNKVECNGVIDQKNTIADNIKKLQSDFFCTLTKPANKWTLISWQPDTIAEDFYEDDIDKDDINFKWGSSTAAFNRLEVEYADASKAFQKDILVYPSLTNDQLIDRDGNVTTKKVEAKFTTSKDQIDKFSSTYYETMRKMGALTFTGFAKAYNCEVGDVISVTHSKYQFNKKLFRVVKVKRSTTVENTATAKLTLAEYNQSAFDIKHVSEQGQGALTPPRIIPAPHNLRFGVSQVGDTYTGCLQWDRVVCGDFLEYVIEYKLSSQPETEWEHYGKTENAEIYLSNLHGAYYDFRVFTRTKFQRHSAFSFLYKQDVNDDTILPKVTGLKLVTTNKDAGITDTRNFVLQWDSMDDVKVKPDLQMLPNATGHQTVKTVKKGYEVEIMHGTTYKRTVYVTEPTFTYTYDMNVEDGISRYMTFKVRILSKGGAKSHDPAVLEAKNRQAQQPVVTDRNGDNAGIQIIWDKCEEEDYSGTRVYINKNKGFVPTDADIPEKAIITDTHFFMASLSGKFYCRVAHYDVFGVDELQYSPEYELNAVSVKDIMTKLDSELMTDVKNQIAGVVSSTDTKILATKDELEKKVQATDKAALDAVQKATKDADTKLQTAQSDLNKALQDTKAKFNADLLKEVADRGTAIKEVQTTIQVLDTKVATDIKALKTQSDLNDAKHTADITATNSALTTKEKALSDSIVKLKAESTKALQDGLAKSTADLEAAKSTLSTADTALADDMKKLRAEVKAGDDKNTAENTALAKVVTDKDAAMAKRVTDLKAQSDAQDVRHSTAITSTNTALTTKEKALSDRIDALTAASNTADASTLARLEEYKKASSTADTALTEDVKKLRAEMVHGDATNKAQVDSISSTLTTKEAALAQRITDTEAKLTKVIADGDTKTTTALSAAIGKVEDAYVAGNEAISKSVQTVSTKVGALEGKVTTAQTAIADINGKMKLSYTASINAEGVFGGWSLIGDTATKESSFVVMSDRFVVVNPKNTKMKVGAFEVRGDKVMIPNAMIDDLSAANIRAGSITV
ncbi:TPA: DUF1983 domain-containing protein, partial [Aeromonas sobria]|nr:DUF1983 domain-containing protein [Aeromonas sobria]